MFLMMAPEAAFIRDTQSSLTFSTAAKKVSKLVIFLQQYTRIKKKILDHFI